MVLVSRTQEATKVLPEKPRKANERYATVSPVMSRPNILTFSGW
jgi:hypothetical protein